ncbi:hypothetical protein LRY65_05740 [Candidatus Woesebacteria bacterium]|nr:hypothetical protein [Candidatus Woesebacteria bacterium]MCD8506761.1 hypothetical protein [Candidatus Woesebacteria bacterium]MCD8527668.1 hypothetical protein [Candidatus Woesebacteria bacterium]MCD8546362.1 hypothetical protein [Candidatus Woesebacteria bacterium]
MDSELLKALSKSKRPESFIGGREGLAEVQEWRLGGFVTLRLTDSEHPPVELIAREFSLRAMRRALELRKSGSQAFDLNVLHYSFEGDTLHLWVCNAYHPETRIMNVTLNSGQADMFIQALPSHETGDASTPAMGSTERPVLHR